MKFLLACGGTGGHVFPALAVAEEIKKREKGAGNILFVGSDTGMEKNIIRKNKFRYKEVPARPLARRIAAVNILNFFMVVSAVFKARRIIKEFSPDVVFGTGGFVSFPVVFAAALMKKPTGIYEPNISPGLANRWLAGFVKFIAAGTEETAAFFPRGKARVTGNPVRKSLLKRKKADSIKKFGLSGSKKTLLIMPGSRAAVKINRVVIDSLKRINSEMSKLQILWMCGEKDFYEVSRAVKRAGADAKAMKFIDDAGAAYAACDAAVLRAGAGTLAEISSLGVPSVLVPYPYATGRHQDKNAAAFAKRGAAIVIRDSRLNSAALLAAVKKVLAPQNRSKLIKNLAKMRKGDGTKNIVDALYGSVV